MISENYSIDEFVKAVKEKDFIEVITLAVEEATLVDRISVSLSPALYSTMPPRKTGT